MAKNSIDAYGAKGKSNVLAFDPDDLVLIEDPKHPMYDERVHLPLNEAMVLNIMALGVVQPIVIAKDPESGKSIVIAGRQRVKHAREANRRFRERGEMTIQVPAIPRRSDGIVLGGIMVSENELRQDDTPLGRARKMTRLLDQGHTEAQVAIFFGCNAKTVKQTLSLLECVPEVRAAVEAGAVNTTAAYQLAKLPPAEQRSKLQELKAAGSGASGHAKARAQRAVMGDTKPKLRTRKEIVSERDASDGERRAALDWVLNGTDGPERDTRTTEMFEDSDSAGQRTETRTATAEEWPFPKGAV